MCRGTISPGIWIAMVGRLLAGTKLYLCFENHMQSTLSATSIYPQWGNMRWMNSGTEVLSLQCLLWAMYFPDVGGLQSTVGSDHFSDVRIIREIFLMASVTK